MSSGELKEISNGTESKAETANDKPPNSILQPAAPFVRPHVKQEIAKQVIRCKLSKKKHLVLKEVIDTAYLDELFPTLLSMFEPQTVTYNGGVANVKEWKISCYLEVMDGGIPTTCPHVELRDLFDPLLAECNDLFLFWYQQQHACNGPSSSQIKKRCKRLMTFITRYTPAPGEQALLKHVDGAGKVDGSIVVSLPIDRWSGPDNTYEGGGLTFWDPPGKPETHYDTRNGDIAFIDRAVWHQADPITKGTRWALVIFYKVE